MRVLHVSGASLKSGAGRGAYWLHEGLLDLGVESHLVTTQAVSEARNVYGKLGDRERKIQHKLLKKSRKRNALFGLKNNAYFNFNTGVFNLADLLKEYPADILHLHWIAGAFLNLKSIKSISIPIVWTLRDMWPFTGGCHYSIDCERYTRSCGSCPLFENMFGLDLTRLNTWNKKRYVGDRIVAVAISDWLADCARKSPIFENTTVMAINNAIDDSCFRPIDQVEARSKLGLTPNKPIALTVSLDFESQYKGYDLYKCALGKLPDDAFTRIYVGGKSASNLDKNGIDVGRIDSPSLLALYYAAADVTIVPSRQEAFGKTAAESMACGTPVVAFNATGPGGIIEHKKTGYLARPYETSDLAAGIMWCLEEKARSEQLGRNSSKHAHAHFSKKHASERYVELYESLT